MKDETEVQDMADKAATAARQPSKFSSMTYEEGVSAALDWVIDTDSTESLLE